MLAEILHSSFAQRVGESTFTGLGFFWKAGWAFVLGYFVSAMIQTFVPKVKLTQFMGDGDTGGVALAALFGSASSSCSFAALSTARALVLKGASFVEALAFMFASTNLVIELGILITIFLGWEYLIAELIGGVVLIGISSVLMKRLAPQSWLEEAREKVEEEAGDIAEDFDWKQRLKSRDGWLRVGSTFVAEWQMVWQEILIGFSVAGIIAVWVPTEVWEAVFLIGHDTLPSWLVAIENALVGPFVAMATFIGSMGNIPLATVLSANGVMFAGIMAFIYSDLVVPPLVMVNIRYYGKRVAFLIAAIMYVSMVATALILWGAFDALGATPSTQRVLTDVTRFAFDYTFWMNLAFSLLAAGLVWAWWRRRTEQASSDGHEHGDDGGRGMSVKDIVTYAFLVLDATGLAIWLIT